MCYWRYAQYILGCMICPHHSICYLLLPELLLRALLLLQLVLIALHSVSKPRLCMLLVILLQPTLLL
jgi:hypothetical protein